MGGNGERCVTIKGRRPGVRITATFQRDGTNTTWPWKLTRVVVEGADLLGQDFVRLRVLELYDALHRKWPGTRPSA